jgi:excisionase family DNA binding protein
MEAITCSVNDAAKAIGVGRVTLYKLINEGRIETVCIGRRRLVRVDSIRQLVAA